MPIPMTADAKRTLTAVILTYGLPRTLELLAELAGVRDNPQHADAIASVIDVAATRIRQIQAGNTPAFTLRRDGDSLRCFQGDQLLLEVAYRDEADGVEVTRQWATLGRDPSEIEHRMWAQLACIDAAREVLALPEAHSGTQA